MSDRDTIAVLATEIGSALEPAARALRAPAAFATFMERLGWDLAAVPAALELLVLPAEQIAETVGDAEVTAEQTPHLLAAMLGFFAALRAVPSQPADSFPPGLDVAAFKSEFPRQLIDHLVADHLLRRQQGWGDLLKLAGVLRLEDVPESASRPAFTRHTVAWEDLGRFLSDPALVLRNTYRWGRPDFRDALLLDNTVDVLDAWHIDYRFAAVEPAIFDSLTAGPLDPDSVFPDALRVPFYEQPFSGFGADVGIELLILPETAVDQPGLAVLPYAAGDFEEDITLTDETSVEVRGNTDFAGGVAIVMRPNRPVEFAAGFGGGAPTTSSAAVSLGVVWRKPGESEIVLIGSPEGSRLRMGSLAVRVGARAITGGGHDLYLETEWTKAGLVVRPAPGEADSFLASLLPSNGAPLDFDVTLGVSTSRGVYFEGGGLEITLPAHVDLGPVEIESVLLSARPVAGAVPVTLAVTVQGELGVVKAVVENVGLTADFTFPRDGSGNLGPIDLALGFRPPNGVGLAIDITEVSGGGFLRSDPETGEYAGALELEFADFLTLKAIGLISTRMPGGAPGFSLLIVVTAEFPDGLQLGFGFKLLAVGGLIGLERTMREQALIDGVRSGALESIMFPRDVVGNAPRILSDLRTFFPPQAGHFLIAPMAKLAWGTPTLITASVGVIIEIPGNVALIGVLKVVLPTEQAPVLRLQVNFAGVIDFDGQRAHLFAALFDSRVLATPIDGEMGVLARWGDDPNLVLTVGGFHPAFTPPPLPFPTPRRVSLDILNRSNARLQVTGYFAVTSNTAQFGAHADLFFKFSAFSVEGDVGFDALFRFSPFAFQIDVSASVSLKAFGVGCFSISLRFALEGPTPWRAHGRGSVSLFFFDISADFDLTWGEERDTTLPPIDVLPLVAAEMSKLEGWETRSPARKTLVSLRRLPATEDQLVLHPTGTLFVRQRAVPLDLTLDRIGSQRPRDVNRVSVDVAGGGLVKRGDVREMFAPAQFKDMDDAAKLSRPAFERQHGGLELSPDGTALASARAVCRSARYEQIVFDEGFRRRPRRFVTYPATLFNHLMAGNSVSRSPLSHSRRIQTQPFADTIGLAGDSFTVAHTRDNTAAAPAFASDAAARDLLARRLAAEPELAGSLHVIPTAEVRG